MGESHEDVQHPWPRGRLSARVALTKLRGSSPNNHTRAYSHDGNRALSFDFHFAERFPVEIVTDVPPNILRDRNASKTAAASILAKLGSNLCITSTRRRERHRVHNLLDRRGVASSLHLWRAGVLVSALRSNSVRLLTVSLLVAKA